MPWSRAHRAAHIGDVAKLVDALQHDTHAIHIRSDDGQTALHSAAIGGRSAAVRVLLDHRADPNAKDCNGLTPLHGATYSNACDTVLLLLERRAHPDGGGNVTRHHSPLHWASRHDHYTVAKTLLEHDADPDFQNETGETPLMLSATTDSFFTARVLLAAGANADATDMTGASIRDRALRCSNMSIVALLAGSASLCDRRRYWRHMRLMYKWRTVARVAGVLALAQRRAAMRAYAPDGIGYMQVYDRFVGIQQNRQASRLII